MFSDLQLRKLSVSVLGFANMRPEEITCAAAVERHFPWIRYRMDDAGAIAAYPPERLLLERLLSQLSSGKTDKVLAAVRKELVDNVHHIVGRVQVINGELQVVDLSSEQAIGVKTSWSLFLAELATRPALLKYFGRCALPECKRFFLGHGGRPGFFCCESHQRRASKRGLAPSKRRRL